MANDIKKPNDIFVATLKAPDASILDLYKNSLTPDNTSFLTMEEYRQTPLVKKVFTEGDTFNEDAFTKAYLLAAYKYLDFTNKKAADEFSKELEYSSSSRYKPLGAKVKSNQVVFLNISNPLGISYSLAGINKIGDPLYTEEENAQSNRIWDPENNKWLDETPESRPFYKKIFGQSLVYAQWDENGEHVDPMTGETVLHYAGLKKTDENGNYYTELLGNRELLNKKVVSLSDILTKEDSWINKYDFFDSDGYDKSATGIAMKTMVQLVPYLIPGFNTYYGAFTAAIGLASVLPTFYKSFESIFTGDRSTIMSDSATLMENWFRKFTSSTSRKGSEGFWNLEQIGNLTVDIFGQLYQQRAAASLAKYLTLPGAMQTKLGQRLSLAYMGLISASDVYNDALVGGYDKRTAGIAALASASALYGIMNFNETTRGLGTWFLRETTGAEENIARAPITKLSKSLYKKFEKGVIDLSEGNPKTLANTINEFRIKARDAFQDVILGPTESMWKSAIVEGVEEVSEEVIQDSVKGMIDTLSWLGFTGKQGSFGGWSNVFSQEGLQRYLATLVGGAAGGALFHLNIDHIEPFIQLMAGKSPQLKQQDYTLVRALMEGRGKEVKSEINRLRKIFNNKLAAGAVKINGETVYLSSENQTQADLIAEAALREVEAMEEFVNELVLALFPNWNDLSDIERHINSLALADDLLENQSKFSEYIENSFAAKATELLLAKRDLDSLSEDADKDTKEKLTKKFNDVKTELSGFFNGDNNINFAIDYKLLNIDAVRSFLLNLDTESYAYNRYGIENYNSLSVEELNKIKKEWEDIVKDSSDNLLETLPKLRRLFLAVLQKTSGDIASFANSDHKSEFARKALSSLKDYDEAILAIELNPDLTPEEKRELMAELGLERMPRKLAELIKLNPAAFTLSDLLDFDLASVLESNGIIDFDAEDNEKDYIRKLINDIAAFSRVNIWTKQAIEKLLDNVNTALSLDSNNLYALKIRELRQSKKSNSEKELESTLDALLLMPSVIKGKNFDNVDSDVELSKLNSILDYFGEFIDKDIYEMLDKSYQPILDHIKETSPNLLSIIDSFNSGGYNNVKGDLLTYADMLKETQSPESAQLAKDINTLLKILPALDSLKTKSLIENPLINAAKKIYSSINGSDAGATLFDVLAKDEHTLRDALSFSTYRLDSERLKLLNSIRRSLDALNAVAFGMASAGDVKHRIMGITELASKFVDLYLNGNQNLKGQYKTISLEDATRVKLFVAQLKEKFNLLLEVSELITRDLNEADLKRESDHYNALALYYGRASENGLTLTIKEKEFNLLIDANLNPDVPYQEYVLDAELLIFNNILKFKKENPTITDEDILRAIIEKFKDDILDIDYDAETAIKLDDTNNINVNSNFIARRINSLIHYSPQEYISDITQIYSENLSSYPSFGLSLVIRSVLSFLHNPELERDFIKLLGIPDETDLSIIPKVLMENVLTIIGAPGAGKNFIISKLKDKIQERFGVIHAISKTSEKANSLASDIRVESGQNLEEFLGLEIFAASKVFDSGITTVFKLLLDSKDSSEKVVSRENVTLTSNIDLNGKSLKESHDYTVEITGKTSSNVDYKIKVRLLTDKDLHLLKLEILEHGIVEEGLSNLEGAYVIDEASFLSPYISSLLNKKAVLNNALIIELGDQTQLGWSAKSGNTYIPYNFLGILGINTPILIGSYRTKNGGKEYNANIFRDALLSTKIGTEEPYLSLYKNTEHPGDSAFEKYFDKFKLVYRITDLDYMGDLVTSDLNQFKEIVSKLLVKPNKTIAFVVDEANENNSIYKELISIVGNQAKILTPETILGDEYDFVVGYKLSKTPGVLNSDIDALKANMLVTRSRDFGLYFDDPNNGLFLSRHVTSKEDDTIRVNSEDNNDVITNRVIDKLNRIKENLPELEQTVNSKKKIEPEAKIEEAEYTEDEIQKKGFEDNKNTETPVINEELAEARDKKEVQVLEKQHFTDASVIHSVFCRLGITKDLVNELKAIESTDGLDNFFNVKNADLENVDLKYFYNAIETINNVFFGKEVYKFNTGQELLDSYELFVKEALERWDDLNEVNLAIVGKKYNPSLDYAYNKVNDLYPPSGKYLRVALKIQGGSFITIGNLGYNGKNSTGEDISATHLEFWNLFTGEEYYKEFSFNSQPNVFNELRHYFKERGLNFDDLKDKGKLKTFGRGIILYTGYRPYSLVGCESNNNLFGINNYLYNRLTLDLLKQIGWHIVSDPEQYEYKPDKFPSVEKAIEAFKNWYSKFRWDESFDDNWIEKVYKRKWAVVQFRGLESSRLPILLDQVTETFEPQYTVNGEQKHRLKLFSIKQLLVGFVNHLNSGNDKIPHLFDGLNSWADRLKIVLLIGVLKLYLLDNGIVDEDGSLLNPILTTLTNMSATFNNPTEKMITDIDIAPILKYLEGKIENYFFKTTFDEDVDESMIRVSRIFESPRYYINWSLFVPIDQQLQTPILSTVIEETIPEPTEDKPEVVELQIQQESIDRNNLTIDEDLINLLDPNLDVDGIIKILDNDNLLTSLIASILNESLLRRDCVMMLNKWGNRIRSANSDKVSNDVKIKYNRKISDLRNDINKYCK